MRIMHGPACQDPQGGMEMTETVKGGAQSEHGSKSKRSRSHNHRSTHRSHSHKNRSLRNHKREDGMAPFQTAVTVDETRDGQEVIEVQILPQDDNWGENTTAVTGNTSDNSGSVEEVSLWPNEPDTGLSFVCTRYVGSVIAAILSAIAFISPVCMLILPKLGFFPSLGSGISPAEQAERLACGADCKGLLVSLCFKLVLLAGGLWAVFIRKSRATLPCVFMYRTIVLLLVFICCFAYWLFYIVQITEGASESATGEETLEYKALVTYASTLADTLLFIHYLAVILIEIRHLQPMYCIKVVRSPDGESRSYAIGQLSIQRAAAWVLDKYYTDFTIYNPYMERVPVSKSKKPTSSFKYYEVDSVNNSTLPHNTTRSVLSVHSRRRDSGHNERFYEEHDYERRVKKRRARLISAAEDAFTHIKRLNNDPAPAVPMDPHEAAQAVFPSLSRALQKYLRVTRQQPRHTVESILAHLAQCLSYDLSPKAFLERFLEPAPVLLNEKDQKEVQSWSLICDELLSRPLRSGTVFQLRQNDVSLHITVLPLPHYNITEEVMDHSADRFVLRLNSETSV